MVLSIIGETEKRPFIYTLLKMCQTFGDVLLVTSDRRYARLIEEPEDDIDGMAGYFQNVFIVVTDSTPDEASMEIGYNLDDYECVIYDHKVDATGDCIIYIAGAEMSESENEMLSYLEEGTDYTTIGFGFGKNKIPYTTKMFMNCELVEAKKVLLPIDPHITTAVAKCLSKDLNMPVRALEKIVNTKK